MLVPQLKASPRYVLNTSDVDTTRIEPDFTQVNATLLIPSLYSSSGLSEDQ